MELAAIKDLLDEKLLAFNRPDFIANDPVAIPHRYTRKEDIEIAGLFAAIIAWGRREMIVRSAHKMMDLMEDDPYNFVMHASETDLDRLEGFVYRTFNSIDFRTLVLGLRRIYKELGGLEHVMQLAENDTDTLNGIVALRTAMMDLPNFTDRSKKHLANPKTGSSAKRLNMYLRWMVRKDGGGVDFGIWNNMKSSQLVCPLDVHTGNVGRKLGLIHRKQNDWKAALELTESLRKMDPDDPVKYDYSLFGLGIFEGF